MQFDVRQALLVEAWRQTEVCRTFISKLHQYRETTLATIRQEIGLDRRRTSANGAKCNSLGQRPRWASSQI